MSTVTCTRKLEWDAMHRVPGHSGKCKCFHGHRYVAEITCSATCLDENGMVIDFGAIKKYVGAWIDKHWDHTAILMKGDSDSAIESIAHSNAQNGSPVYFLEGVPTAENIATELASIAQNLLEEHDITVVMVRVWETPNCYATWRRG